MANTSTCIIPFYNEEGRILGVLNKLLNIKYFSKIILVNDGSQDNGLQVVQSFIKENKLQHVIVLTYKQNKGKSYAVNTGLQKVDTKYVFLFDADLINIKVNEINNMIESMYKHHDIGMGILRRIHAKRYIKVLYRDLILSGQRMMKTIDLIAIFKNKFDKYQLEVAINTYMHTHNKTVIRYPFSADNTFKSQKLGLRKGLKKDIFMYKDIMGYQGTIKFIKHSFLFKPRNIKFYKNKYK